MSDLQNFVFDPTLTVALSESDKRKPRLVPLVSEDTVIQDNLI